MHSQNLRNLLHLSLRLSHVSCRVSSHRTVEDAVPDALVGKLLPTIFHGSPAERRADEEDALAVVQRLGRPHQMITITCNPDWPEIGDNSTPH